MIGAPVIAVSYIRNTLISLSHPFILYREIGYLFCAHDGRFAQGTDQNRLVQVLGELALQINYKCVGRGSFQKLIPAWNDLDS